MRHRVNVDLFSKQPVVVKQEAEKTWLPKFVQAVMEGRWPEVAEVSDTSRLLVADFLADYRKRHCEAEQLNMDSLGSKLNVIGRRFGHLLLTDLEARLGRLRTSRPT